MTIFDYQIGAPVSASAAAAKSTNVPTHNSKSATGSSVATYADLMKQLGQPAFRAKQLAQWLWVQRAKSYDDMTNLPAQLRDQLKTTAPLKRALAEKILHSKDGTRKYLIRFADGTSVEAVGLPSSSDNDPSHTDTGADTNSTKRLTVCISTQAGCALGCIFCATGRSGLIRNLSAGEIAEQVRIVSEDFNMRASNVVVMGQGEPFQNYNATLAGLRILNASEAAGGFGIGARRITISTSGIVAGIRRLTDEPEQFTLAVSLHSAIQETRDKLMPGLASNNLNRLATALLDYWKATHRRPSLEYALIKDTNTSPEEITALTAFAQRTKAHVNLIPLNTIEASKNSHHETRQTKSSDDADTNNPTSTNLKAATQTEATKLANTLKNAGIEATIRSERGTDIKAACGQLAQIDEQNAA